MPSSSIDPLLFAYVVVFAVAALVCFGAVARAREIEDPETSRGLVWLLLFSGSWAACHVGFLVAPVDDLKVAFYLVGLIFGLATLGPWLYFCSAYTGRTFHRDPALRRVALVVFVGISALKLTNPIHGLYVAVDPATQPFPHLSVDPQELHWIVAGLAYTVTAFGGFALFDRFRRAGADTTPLLVLVALTGLPIGLDLLGYLTPALLKITHEPIGVAIFAVGILVLYTQRFQAVRLTSDIDDPVVVLDGDDRVRDFNEPAASVFPGLASGTGRPLSTVAPSLADYLDAVNDPAEAATAQDAPASDDAGPGAALSVARGGETRYFRLTTTPVALGAADEGRRVVLTDVTDAERQRRALKRQNQRLERFTSGVSHDLRNPLNAANAQLAIAREQLDDENLHLAAVAEELERMSEMIDDLLSLARQGRDIGETETVSLSTLVRECWGRVDPIAGGVDLEVGSDLRFEADPDRLQQVLENLLRNAVEHGADGSSGRADEGEGLSTIRVGALDDGDGFYVADDGPGIAADRRERVFETGHTTADGGTGFGLAIVREIATAHGWDVRVTDSATGGARFEVTGVETVA